MKLTVVIPTYNEAENLPKLIPAILALPLPAVRVLVVDDNSPDGTGQIADELALRNPSSVSVLHRTEKKGLGTAYITGFQLALKQGAEVVAQMDADFSHPPEKLPVMVKALTGCDAVIGSRYVAGGSVDAEWPLWRKGLSAFGNFYARLILNLPVRDATAGFRIWCRKTLLGMPLGSICSNGYAFQIEMTHCAARLGYRFKEIPIYFADRRLGSSKMSFDIQRETAIKVWQIRRRYRHIGSTEDLPINQYESR